MDFEFLGGHLAPIPSSIERRIRQELSWIWWAMWLHAEVAELQYFAIANASGYKKSSPSMLVESWMTLKHVEMMFLVLSPSNRFSTTVLHLSKSLTVATGRPENAMLREHEFDTLAATVVWTPGWMVLLASERWTKGLSHVIYVYIYICMILHI